MNTEEINFHLWATSAGNIYRANFAGCDIEMAEDKRSLQIIDEAAAATLLSIQTATLLSIQTAQAELAATWNQSRVASTMT